MSDFNKYKVVEQYGNHYIENGTEVIAMCSRKRHADMIVDALNTRITDKRRKELDAIDKMPEGGQP